jgi:hypothetical protein
MVTVTQVHPQDESLGRWIDQRYRYDPERHERRNVTEIAYDNQVEFEAYLDEARARLVREGSGPRRNGRTLPGYFPPDGSSGSDAAASRKEFEPLVEGRRRTHNAAAPDA